MLDLNEVAIFVQVVQAGSFAQAARQLKMPANSVSRRVQRLEEQLGVRLMQRSTRQLSLTEAGLAFHENAALQVEQLLAAAARVTSSRKAPEGIVRVAAAADFFEVFAMEWVREFRGLYPAIRLDFLLSDARADLIGAGIDVAFRAGELDNSGLVARKIATHRTVLAASPGYLREHGEPLSLASLAAHECIRPWSLDRRTRWRLVGPEGPADVEISGRFCASTAVAQLKAAAAGLGICLLPRPLLLRALASQDLVEVLRDYCRSDDLYVVYPSRKQRPQAVVAFIDFAERKLLESARSEAQAEPAPSSSTLVLTRQPLMASDERPARA